MKTTEKEKWDKIIQKYISCDCGDIYLSRNLTAPDCPYHSNDWESPMEEFLKELKEQQAEQIRLYEKTLDITTDRLMGVQAERNELKEAAQPQQPKEPTEFLFACKEERIAFVNKVNEQNWNAPLRTNAENLLIMYDQLMERLKEQPPYNLEDAIKKASENWRDIDPDKFLSEIRG